MFSDPYLSLTVGEAHCTEAERLGRWRVVSGEVPGQVINLYRHENSDPMVTAQGAERHELMRAISCSPLR